MISLIQNYYIVVKKSSDQEQTFSLLSLCYKNIRQKAEFGTLLKYWKIVGNTPKQSQVFTHGNEHGKSFWLGHPISVSHSGVQMKWPKSSSSKCIFLSHGYRPPQNKFVVHIQQKRAVLQANWTGGSGHRSMLRLQKLLNRLEVTNGDRPQHATGSSRVRVLTDWHLHNVFNRISMWHKHLTFSLICSGQEQF